MSKLKVNRIENTSTADGGVAIDTDGHVTIDGQQLPTAGPLSNRNLIINGAMQVAQRGTSESAVNTAGYKTIDRMRLSMASLTTAQFTHEQVSDAPAGFSYSLKLTTTTAEGSVGAQDALRPVEYRIEGQDLQQLQYGTANAKSLTLSFYVKSSEAGTYGVTLYRDEATDRQISATYSIAAGEIGQWVYRTITFLGDTGSAITNDNTARFYIYWHTGAGSDYTSTDSTSWGNYTGSGFAFGNAVNLQNILNSTWQITGVQLEIGSKATPFEHRSYGDELARCDRYCQVYRWPNQYENICFGGATAGGVQLDCIFPLRNGMRTAPSTSDVVSAVGHFRVNDWRQHDEDANSLTFYSAGTSAVKIGVTKPTANMTVGYMGYLNVSTSAGGNASWTFSAEL